MCRNDEALGMFESKITSKGQTTLPKEVRKALSIGPGDRVRYVIDGNMALILPVRPISSLKGLPYDGPPVTLGEMQQAIVDGATGR